ncbi:DUF5988 family protein [Streptomyces sp. NPDC001401]|uniref:DUF5988 family protein n=1 Tax=Streptomyces sp. NPDC001401 TaxID=3364570 RepID=UPI0036A65E4A
MITVLLRGAPDGMEPLLELDTQTLPERIAVPFYGCHQHFERADDEPGQDDRTLPVFVWTYATAIAE